MSAERCETCRFWRRFNDKATAGHCRRYPPVRNGDPDYEYTTCASQVCDFPATTDDDWCGEFSPATVQREPIKPQN